MDQQDVRPPTAVTSVADVATERGERWRKQLVSHFGHKVDVTEDGDATVLHLAGGNCRLSCDDEALHLAASAPDEATLSRVCEVVGGHLERFAAKEGLRVVWLS